MRSLSLEEAEARLDEFARWLASREVTFGIAAGVGQCLQALSRLLPGWLGKPEQFISARRIINGTDRAALVGSHAEQFQDALLEGRYA